LTWTGVEPTSSIAELAGLCRSQLHADMESPVVVAHSGSGMLLLAIADVVDALHEVYRTCDLRSLHWLMRIGGAVR
jgi:hypothetical protein